MPRGYEIIAEAIASAGARHVFTLPDGLLLPVYRELERRGVQPVIMRHELTAAQAADGYARYTRKPGFALAPVGPGASLMMPGLVQAWYSGSPVVAVGGRTSIARKDMWAFEEADTYEWAKPFTKFSRQCVDACHLSRCLRHALQASCTGRMGPSYIEVPRDVASGTCEEPHPPPSRAGSTRPYPGREAVRRFLELLAESSRPVVVAGSGAYWSGVCDALVRFSEKLGVPVATESLAVGCMPEDHPYWAGPAPLGLATREADLVVFLGARPDGLLGYGLDENMYSGGARIVQVDVEPESMRINVDPDLAVWADARAFLEAVIQQAGPSDRKDESWARGLNTMVKSIVETAAEAAGPREPIPPGYVLRVLSEVYGRDALYVLDGGDTTGWGYLHLRAYEPLQVHWAHGPFGGIGAGVPVALAGKLARPDRHFVLVTGDGSFLMGALDLDTAARYCAPVTVVVLDDRSWGDVYHNWLLTGGDQETARRALLEERRLDLLAEALGGLGAQVRDPARLREALEAAREASDCRPRVIQVIVDREEPSPVSQVLLRDR